MKSLFHIPILGSALFCRLSFIALLFIPANKQSAYEELSLYQHRVSLMFLLTKCQSGSFHLLCTCKHNFLRKIKMADYIEVLATVRIPNQKIKDLITTALEGACRYWAEFIFPPNYKEKYGSAEDIPLKGGQIGVRDVETDEHLGYLNHQNIQRGLQLMADRKDLKGKQVPARHFKNLATDNEDAETADVFMQLSVMGEIVYS